MLRETRNGVLVELRVRPDSGEFRFVKKGGKLVLEVVSPAKNGRANIEIVRKLKRMFGKDVRIVRGFKTRDKLILVIGAELKEIEGRINPL